MKTKVQREIRALKNDWWFRQPQGLQEMTDSHDYCGLFGGIRADLSVLQ